MGLGDWVRRVARRPAAGARGKIERYDPATKTWTVQLEQGGTRSFYLDQCMFTPFVGLPVLLEGESALRLAPEALPRYAQLLEEHAEAQRLAEEQERSRAQAERETQLAALVARRPVDARLEAALEREADDLEALQVYSDVLQEKGHALGRLIAIACALERGAGDASALERERDQLQSEQTAALRLPADLVRLEWRRGLIEAARFGRNSPDGWLDAPDGSWAEEALARLLAAPAGRFLRRLAFGALDEEGDLGDDLLAAVARGEPFGALRDLLLGDFVRGDEIELSWTSLKIPPPYRALANLERLELQAGALELGEIELPALRRFEVRTGGLTEENIAAIVRARWPRLERLSVWFGDPSYGATGDVGDLAPLLSGEGIPALRELGLCNAMFADELCRVLPRSPVLARLRVLDLSRGALSDAGARELVEHGARLAHLEQLHVEECCLSPEGSALLRSLPCPVSIGEQRDYGDADRYVAVGE